jgi:hypothetical protein
LSCPFFLLCLPFVFILPFLHSFRWLSHQTSYHSSLDPAFVIPNILPPNFLVLRLFPCYVLEFHRGFLSCPFFLLYLPLVFILPFLRLTPRPSSRLFSHLTSSCEVSYIKSLFLPFVCSSAIVLFLPTALRLQLYRPSFHFYEPMLSVWPLKFVLPPSPVPRQRYCECPRNLQIHVTVSSSIFCLLPHPSSPWSLFIASVLRRSLSTQPTCNFLIVAASYPFEYSETK